MIDKHRLKLGEPNYPVAAAERGRRVLVRRSEVLEVADHDFTRFSLIPSVILSTNIPSDASNSCCLLLAVCFKQIETNETKLKQTWK